jgi:hypothetical protein
VRVCVVWCCLGLQFVFVVVLVASGVVERSAPGFARGFYLVFVCCGLVCVERDSNSMEEA